MTGTNYLRMAIAGLSVFGLVVGVSMTPSVSVAAELVSYQVVDEAIPESLTGQAGDAQAGKKIAVARKKGNCLACHTMPVPEADHGETGPDLRGVASRMTAGELRLRLVDPKQVNDETMMPSFYALKRLHRVGKKYQGQTILSAQEVEDVLAYLSTLKDE